MNEEKKLNRYRIDVTMYALENYVIEAPSEEAAEQFAWREIHAICGNGVDPCQFDIDISDSDEKPCDTFLGD